MGLKGFPHRGAATRSSANDYVKGMDNKGYLTSEPDKWGSTLGNVPSVSGRSPGATDGAIVPHSNIAQPQSTRTIQIPGASPHDLITMSDAEGDRVVEIDRDMYACETYPKASARAIPGKSALVDPNDNFPSEFGRVPGSQQE